MRTSVLALAIVMFFAATASAQRAYTIFDQDVVFGLNQNGPGVPDFKWDNANRKLKTRSLILAEHADPSEVAFRRTGPDNSADGTPLQPINGSVVNIGLIYSQALGSNMDFEAKTPQGPCSGRGTEIALQAIGPQTATSRPGRVAIATTRQGACAPTISWALESDGTQNWSGQPTYAVSRTASPCAMVKIRWSDGANERDGYLPIYCQ